MSNALQAVIVDLDDTLYPQSAFLDLAWAAVAAEATALGLDGAALHQHLVDVAAVGSDRGGIIDEALRRSGANQAMVEPLVAAFWAVRPRQLTPYPGVVEALGVLHGTVPLALITDGYSTQQRAKLTATGLGHLFDVVVCTDDLDRRFRKPHPLGFRVVIDALGVRPEHAVMIGDRPDKDVAGAASVGMRAIRVRHGEHAHQSDAGAWQVCDTTADALALVRQLLAAGSFDAVPPAVGFDPAVLRPALIDHDRGMVPARPPTAELR